MSSSLAPSHASWIGLISSGVAACGGPDPPDQLLVAGDQPCALVERCHEAQLDALVTKQSAAGGRQLERDTAVCGQRGPRRHDGRLGDAFATGYQQALGALVKSDVVSALCVTEARGNSPKDIDTTLTPVGDGFELTGSRKWATTEKLSALRCVLVDDSMIEPRETQTRSKRA